MTNTRKRIGAFVMAAAAVMGLLTLPTDRTLGITMLFAVVLATGHALIVSGPGENVSQQPSPRADRTPPEVGNSENQAGGLPTHTAAADR
jgi:hypothetical protein